MQLAIKTSPETLFQKRRSQFIIIDRENHDLLSVAIALGAHRCIKSLSSSTLGFMAHPELGLIAYESLDKAETRAYTAYKNSPSSQSHEFHLSIRKAILTAKKMMLPQAEKHLAAAAAPAPASSTPPSATSEFVLLLLERMDAMNEKMRALGYRVEELSAANRAMSEAYLAPKPSGFEALRKIGRWREPSPAAPVAQKSTSANPANPRFG